MTVTEPMRQAFAQDGAIVVRQMFDSEQMDALREAFDHGVAHPSPFASRVFEGTTDEHFNDVSNFEHAPRYQALVEDLGLADFAADLWNSAHVWFLGEELFVKSGGKAGRSLWHQDTPYFPMEGAHMLNLWISFESLPAANSLEVVRGSHRGTTYDGAAYLDPNDPTRPLWADGTFPRLPDIEAEREKNPDTWDILSWDLEPGDVLALHSGTLHGGAPVTPDCPTRHTLVFRFYGDEVFYRPFPTAKPDYAVDIRFLDERSQTPGEPYRSAALPQLR